MRSMARAPKFSTPQHKPPASGWKAGHRAPGEYDLADVGPMGGFYGQLDGVCYGEDPMDKIPNAERRAFPDCGGAEGY